MYRETAVEIAQLGEAARAACETLEPLGAYASEDRLTYLFAEPGGVVALFARRGGEAVPVALAGSYPLFDWDEREMRDTHGAEFSALPNARPLFIGGGGVPAALTAEGKGVSLIVVGPVHAGIIEPGRFTFSTGGETVIHLDGQLSYSRRGVERFLEGQLAVDAAPRIARICAACSAARSWSYACALEQLAQHACDEPTEWARIVCAELERVYNHVFDLGSAAAGAGYGYGQTHALALKERVHRVCAAASGHRFLFDAIVPGGVRAGVLADPAGVRAQIGPLRDDVEAYLEALFRSRSVVSRFTGAGRVSAETARAFGATGPARRATGDAIDVRRLVPYGAYRSAPPAPLSETVGDVAARCRIKRAEIGASFTLIESALDALGTFAPPPAAELAVAPGIVSTVSEGPRGAESVSIACDAQGRLTRFHAISASYRNWPIVLRAMEGNIVPDFPLVNKSFNLCYACADR